MFISRQEAGQRLGQNLAQRGIKADRVIGLPRGGVVVASEVARVLRLPMDVLVVRKIGHPRHREFAVGALAEGGVVVLDENVLDANPVLQAELEAVIAEEKQRLRSYQACFHSRGAGGLAGQTVLLVDDGLATGATMEAAVLSARGQEAGRIVVAVPVASPHAMARLQRIADEALALLVDPGFEAVGSYYDTFSQTTDQEVIELLKEG